MNEEYLSYVDYLKSVNFEKKLEKLKEKYDGKKVILFGMGLFLDAILDNYDIKKYINVIGISDKRIIEDRAADYKGFNLYKPLALRALKFNVVLDTNIMFEKSKQFLKRNYYVNKHIIIEPIIQTSAKDIFEKALNKLYAGYKFLIESKNIFTTIKYFFICETQEINSKTNYTKQIKRLRTSTKPIRTVFIASDVQHSDFIGLYNILYFDKNFKLFPIILVTNNLLETEEINEDKMAKDLELLRTFKIDAIDDMDRETCSLASLHAFKPDLIFYQKPIHIKDDFNPAKMSEKALTFTVEYSISNADFAAIGSKYFRKQVSNLWKVFVGNKDDKNLYSEYTDTQNKNIVMVINKNLNSGIVKYLKKQFKKS